MFFSGISGKLKKIVGRDAVLDRPDDLMLYEYDGSLARGMPNFVVFPQTTAHVSAIVKLAARESLAIVPRGAGTGLSGGSIARKGGIVLAFAPHAIYAYYKHEPHYWGLTPSEDQSLAGLLMALEQSVVMGIALVWLFVRMLNESEREAQRAERYEVA